MAKVDRSSLLQFLREPHFAHEVAEHFGISRRLARLSLHKAIASGQILVSKKPFSLANKDSGKREQVNQALYVSKGSPMVVDGWKKFRLRAENCLSAESGDSLSTRFASFNQRPIVKDSINQKLSAFSKRLPLHEKGSTSAKRSYKIKGILASKFDMSSKVRLASRIAPNPTLRKAPASSRQGRVNSLSCVERIRLFKALSVEPLAFLDLRGRFGVSRQIIKGLLKNGLVAQTWATRGIGVKFELTHDGEMYLKQLEAASECEPKLAKKALVRLKQRIPF